MRGALAILDAAPQSFLYEGEMHADLALDPELRERNFPGSRFEGSANVLVFANTDAASAVRNILKMRANGLEVGPILMGMGNRAHIVTPSITARGLLNISALGGNAGRAVRLRGRGPRRSATPKGVTCPASSRRR